MYVYVRICKDILKDILTWISMLDILKHILLRSVWISSDLFGSVSKSVWICFKICLDLFGYLYGSSRISVLINFWACSLALLLGASGPSAAFWKQGLLARIASSSRDACSYTSRQRRALRARSTGGGRGVGRALENDTKGGAEGESGAEGGTVSQPKSACPAENVGDGWSENKTS